MRRNTASQRKISFGYVPQVRALQEIFLLLVLLAFSYGNAYKIRRSTLSRLRLLSLAYAKVRSRQAILALRVLLAFSNAKWL